MSIAKTIPQQLQTNIDNIINDIIPNPWLTKIERVSYTNKIRDLLQQRDAVLIAHYYVNDELQALADKTGGYVSDSLDMANFGVQHDAKICGNCKIKS